jgi:hypothetical protein
MSDTDNRESTPAPQGEAIAASQIPSDTAAKPAPAAPAPRISESSFEAAHADLPPLSTLGGNSDAAIVASESSTTAGNGARRGRGRGLAPAGKFGAAGQPAKVAFGVVENPADLTENLSGKHVAGYGDQQPQQREERPRREERKPREAAPATAEVNPEAAAEAAGWKETPASAEAAPAAEPAEVTSETGPKEFVPPVSEGTFKADLNPETERKAREERRQQRDDRPRGDRPQSQGGEFRGDRRLAEGRQGGEQRRDEQRQPRGDRPQGGEFRGERQPRQEGGQRHERGEGRPQGERRNDHGNNRGEQQRGNRGPNRLTIEVPKIPVQEPTTFFGKMRLWIAEKIWGVPASDEIGFSSVSKPMTPHSREWQFGRGQQQRRDGRPGDNRNGGQGQRREFRHGNGGQGSQNPNRDGRHRPHARGGNHRDQHGRDGNPRG